MIEKDKASWVCELAMCVLLFFPIDALHNYRQTHLHVNLEVGIMHVSVHELHRVRNHNEKWICKGETNQVMSTY